MVRNGKNEAKSRLAIRTILESVSGRLAGRILERLSPVYELSDKTS
jgi:hypothetical protein